MSANQHEADSADDTAELSSAVDADGGSGGGQSARVYGPAFRPDEVMPVTGIGPVLPVHLVRELVAQRADEDLEEAKAGRVIEFPDTIGPLAPGNELHDALRHWKSEPCGGGSGADGSGASDKPADSRLQREAWMTELLPVSNRDEAALKNRRFRTTNAPAGRGADASWFSTPGATGDRDAGVATERQLEKKNREAAVEAHATSSRDCVMSKMVADYNANVKRGESLLDLHAKKRSKKSKKEKEKKKHKSKGKERKSSKKSSKDKMDREKTREGSKKSSRHYHRHERNDCTGSKTAPASVAGALPASTRKPFDRDSDLKISSMDTAARLALIARSKQLVSRFEAGQSQFL